MGPAETALRHLLDSNYGVSGRLSRLGGENRNFLVESEEQGKFVLKVTAGEPSATEDWEPRIVERLVEAGVALDLPRQVRGKKVRAELAPGTGLEGLRARLYTFVGGVPLGEVREPGRELFRDLGARLAEVHLAWGDETGLLTGRTHEWDLRELARHRSKLAHVSNSGSRRMLERGLRLFEGAGRLRFGELPEGVIHGDVNDENVLTDGARVTGLLDFGDALRAPLVVDLGIALAYALLDRDDPLTLGAELVAGYHGARPLGVAELEVLYPVLIGRLCQSLAIAAERRIREPAHPNWFVTEAACWRTLERLDALEPVPAGRALAANTGVAIHAEFNVDSAELLARRKALMGASLSLSYEEPLTMLRGRGPYLIDHTGRPHLDLVNNVCHVGHAHPTVVGALARQAALLNTNTRYLHPGVLDYAERLVATMPAGLEVCYFVNSGSEANELALRLARAATGRRGMLVVDGAYHGHSSALIDISPYKFKGPGGAGAPESWVSVVPVADGYRGAHKGQGRDAGEAYARELERVLAAAEEPPAAFISESILSCGGQVVPPEGYFKAAYAHVRAAGALCIADEVQVGFGRVGEHFWAFELQDVVPDIVVLGKPIGNGHPLAAVVTTRAIAESFANGMEWFATFGGNPVSAAVGLAVLDVIRDEGLQERARTNGSRFLEGLRDLAAKHALVGDARGVGLFLGIELIRDAETLEPADTECAELVERMKRRGYLLSVDGPLHNVVKIKPPLAIQLEDVESVLGALDEELTSMGDVSGGEK